jgi:ABC-type uncharacterized transport system substrate-binding protein
VTHVAVIYNPGTAFIPLLNRGIEAAAPSFGMTVTLAPVHDDAAIEQAIAAQADGDYQEFRARRAVETIRPWPL